MRVLTNTTWVAGREIAGRAAAAVSPRGARLLAFWRYDAALLNIESRWLLVICALKKLMPWARCRILSVDLILTHPRGLTGQLAFRVRRWLLREVDRFVLYYRDTAELRAVYGIPAERVKYVPFKVNTRDLVLATPVTDDGFFLSCGRSNRDYRTLYAAFRGLPYHCFVLVSQAEAEAHGTRVDGAECPPNVTLVADDGSAVSWNAWIARAHAVVLPIQPGRLSPSGIGTYLVAMALGKCVVITESAATRGILDDRHAVLVPPSDAGALREAVTRVAEDRDLRERTARGGREYALSLGGDERLERDIVRELGDLMAPQASPALQPV
jgi:glycosyltransferase involved in cell wall biosynthesis